MIDQRLLAAADAQIDVLRAQPARFGDLGIHPSFDLRLYLQSTYADVRTT
jgi:hypothetical protein